MNTPITHQSLIEQILQIQHMEHGSLSTIGQGPHGPYFNLNSWENDKNCCRYVHRLTIIAVGHVVGHSQPPGAVAVSLRRRG